MAGSGQVGQAFFPPNRVVSMYTRFESRRPATAGSQSSAVGCHSRSPIQPGSGFDTRGSIRLRVPRAPGLLQLLLPVPGPLLHLFELLHQALIGRGELWGGLRLGRRRGVRRARGGQYRRHRRHRQEPTHVRAIVAAAPPAAQPRVIKTTPVPARTKPTN